MKAPLVLEPDELEKLVLTRGLLTCCKMDILSCQLESFTRQVGELEPTAEDLGILLHGTGSHWGRGGAVCGSHRLHRSTPAAPHIPLSMESEPGACFVQRQPLGC